MGDGLVHQFVTQDGGLALITIGYLAPYLTEQLLRGLALEEPGIAMTIIDIITRLTTRTVVHIKDQIQVISLAPTDDAINTLITVFLACLTHIILVSKEFIVKGQTDGVGTLLGDEVDIGTSDIIILELLPELGREIWSYSLLEEQIDHPG